jgi:hypothetical protein
MAGAAMDLASILQPLLTVEVPRLFKVIGNAQQQVGQFLFQSLLYSAQQAEGALTSIPMERSLLQISPSRVLVADHFR